MRLRIGPNVLNVTLVMLLLALTPGLCLLLDRDHIIPHSDCPFCNLLSVFAAIVMWAMAFIVLRSRQSRPLRMNALRGHYRSYTGGPTSARDPPRS